MAAELEARIGPRVYPNQSWHRPGYNSLDDTNKMSQYDSGTYATSQIAPPDSGYDSAASSRASTPPARLLDRITDSVSPKSLLERVQPRLPFQPIALNPSSVAGYGMLSSASVTFEGIMSDTARTRTWEPLRRQVFPRHLRQEAALASIVLL